MTPIEQLETKIRQSIPELKEEYEVFQEGAIDADMITPIMLNHVLEYIVTFNFKLVKIDISKGVVPYLAIKDYKYPYDSCVEINLKSAYLKDQSEEMIKFLNELK